MDALNRLNFIGIVMIILQLKQSQRNEFMLGQVLAASKVECKYKIHGSG